MAKGKAKTATTKKKMSQTKREIIKTAIFLIIVGILVAVYVVYPLIKSKTAMGRQDDIEAIKIDSLPPNDPTACIETGLTCDTFRVEADGMTSLAALLIPAAPDSLAAEPGTVILLHADTSNRTAMLPWAQQFADSGYNVVLYDQRASGFSSGQYHGEGWYEANDLEEMIAWLELHDRLTHPLYVVGHGVGADAALLAALEESRIDGVVAIEPYLSTDRMWDLKRQEHGLYWFPFRKTMLWWWYNIRSSYAAAYREVDDLEAVPNPTLLIVPTEALDADEVVTLRELSEKDQLTVQTTPENQRLGAVFTFINARNPVPVPPADSTAAP